MTHKKILFEIGNYWVTHAQKGKGFEVYKTGITHSVRVAIVGWEGEAGLDRAKIEATKRAQKDFDVLNYGDFIPQMKDK